MNISLTDDMKEFVQMKVASGAFPSEEAVLLEAVRRLRQEDQKYVLRRRRPNNHARGPHRLRGDRLVREGC